MLALTGPWFCMPLHLSAFSLQSPLPGKPLDLGEGGQPKITCYPSILPISVHTEVQEIPGILQLLSEHLLCWRAGICAHTPGSTSPGCLPEGTAGKRNRHCSRKVQSAMEGTHGRAVSAYCHHPPAFSGLCTG